MRQSTSPLAYYQTSEFAATLRGQEVRVVSKPGLPDWNRVRPASVLLAEAVAVLPGSRVLNLGCGHGALGVVLARQARDGQVRLLDTNLIAVLMAERTLRANGVVNGAVSADGTPWQTPAGAFDAVAMEVPRGRKLARQWLVQAHAALRSGGELYLAGPKDGGIQSAIEDAKALFGNATVLTYRERNRVARATKEGQAEAQGSAAPPWVGEAGIAAGTWYEFGVEVRGQRFQLASLPGLFAWDKLDDGTALLLSALQVPHQATVLDIGCGYGIIGLLAARLGAARVDLVDVDLPAVAAASENIRRNAIAAARAFASDAVDAVREGRYDLVATNPPFHAGKAVDYDVAQSFIEGARSVLAPGGKFVLVANRFIRYDRTLRRLFTRVESLAETSRYHVLQAS